MMRVRAFHSPSGSVVVGEITDINATGDVRMVPDGMLESVILRNGVWVMAVSETKP